MKKSFALLTLLSLFLVLTNSTFSQTRQRRVGDSAATQTSPGPAPRPPVLSGSNNPGNQKPTQQQPESKPTPEEVDAGDIIKVNTTLVTIPVSVMDRDGRYVPNLRKEDFKLWEDGVQQDIAFFSSVDKPFSLVLMLDTSPSTQFRLEDIQDAAVAFINQLRPDDRVMVISFNDDIKVLSEMTNDRYRLERAVRRAYTDDGTRLYDAVDMVINRELSRIQGRKAIVLFTDGVDTTSHRATYQSNLIDAQEADALIYAVQYDTAGDINAGPSVMDPNDVLGQILGDIFGGGNRRRGNNRGGGGGGRGRQRDDYRVGDEYLKELTNNTGGRQYRADSLQNMSYAFGNVAEELRRQYSLGFYPKQPPQAGQRRQIKVRANQPNLAVRSRDSYIFNPSVTAVADDSGNRQNSPVLRKLAGPTRPSTKF
jgi:Ca-activated chloride channel family protein